MTMPLQIDHRAVEDLIPYATNPRTHTPEQIAQIAASIIEFGWTNPILIGPDNVVIAGHARLEAARKLRLTARRATTRSSQGSSGDASGIA